MQLHSCITILALEPSNNREVNKTFTSESHLHHHKYYSYHMDTQKATNTNVKTNSVKPFLIIWVWYNSSNCIFNGHKAKENKAR